MTTKELAEELIKRGVRLKIGGCGCCGSPWVNILLDGVKVLDEDDFNFDNTEDKCENVF